MLRELASYMLSIVQSIVYIDYIEYLVYHFPLFFQVSLQVSLYCSPTKTFIRYSFKMKITSTLAFVASVLLPALTSANIGVSWSFPNASQSGLKEVTFPISIANAPHKHGFYFAQQYAFKGIDGLGYTGLQPQVDKDGSSIVHAVFSSFQDGTTANDDNCKNGADGGSGVSCSVDIAATYDHLYNLQVKNTNGTTWSGTLVDSVLGNSTHIGSYTLPSNATGIKSSQVGFIEYFPFNSGSHTCMEQPYTNVTFHPPTSTTSGSGSGTLKKPYQYGDCSGKDNFDVNEVGDEVYEVSAGFKNNTST